MKGACHTGRSERSEKSFLVPFLQEELDKQNPVIDDIDTQLNKVTGQLKTNNAKLKGLITQVSCVVMVGPDRAWQAVPHTLCFIEAGGMPAVCGAQGQLHMGVLAAAE